MAITRRTQLLMSPAEYERLSALARQKTTSVAHLIRTAVREKYLAPEPSDRAALVDSILRMGLPGMDWEKVREEIEDAHADLP